MKPLFASLYSRLYFRLYFRLWLAVVAAVLLAVTLVMVAWLLSAERQGASRVRQLELRNPAGDVVGVATTQRFRLASPCPGWRGHPHGPQVI